MVDKSQLQKLKTGKHCWSLLEVLFLLDQVGLCPFMRKRLLPLMSLKTSSFFAFIVSDVVVWMFLSLLKTTVESPLRMRSGISRQGWHCASVPGKAGPTSVCQPKHNFMRFIRKLGSFIRRGFWWRPRWGRRNYLHERGLISERWSDIQLGFEAPAEGNYLYRNLLRNSEKSHDSGLFLQSSDAGTVFDAFRIGSCFPTDDSGRPFWYWKMTEDGSHRRA